MDVMNAAMRLIFSLLIFAITLSGYMAAAHAFELVAGEQTQAMDMAACDGCQQDNSPDAPDQNDDSTKNCGVNCPNCCSGSAGFFFSTHMRLQPVSANLSSFYTDKLAGEYLFSLLRPPRNLV